MNGDLENKLAPGEVEGLVAACRDGDYFAYASLVKSYSGRIFAICYGILGNAHDAEDVARQTLLKGFTDIKRIRRKDRFGTWIGRVARNLCVDFIHRQKRRRNLHEEFTTDRQNSREYPKLRNALAELSEDHRLALLLYYFSGSSTKAVEEVLDISQDVAQVHLSQARKRLRKLLQAKGDV